MIKKLSKWFAVLPVVGILAVGTASVVIGANGSFNRSASASAPSSLPAGVTSGTTAVNNLVTNGQFAYDNNNSSTVDLEPAAFPEINALATTTVATKSLANLGTVKSVRLDSLTPNTAATSPKFISEISLVAPDGTHVPYKINPYLSTWMQSLNSYPYAEQAWQDLDYSTTGNHYVPMTTHALRLTLELLRPSLISRIEIATDGNEFVNVMLTDTFNNYWTTQAYDKPNQPALLYNAPTNPIVPAVPTKIQTNRTNDPVSYGASADEYALSNQTFAGRKVFPGVQTTFYQYFNYGYDPLFSIPYSATGREGVSVFYQGASSLEDAISAAAPVPGAYDGTRFSIGTVRLGAAQGSVWAYTVSPLVDFNRLKALDKTYIKYLFDNKRIIARSKTPIQLTTDQFSTEAGKILNLRLPISTPVSGVGSGASIAAASLLNEEIFKPVLPEGKTKPSPTYLTDNFELRYRTEMGYKYGANVSYFNNTFSDTNEDAETTNIKSNWVYDQHAQLEVELNAKLGTKLSLGSFGRSYSASSYSLDNPSPLFVEPTVTPADFIFNSLITNYGMEELGNISLITISFNGPYRGTEYAANNLQQFLSELTIYADRDSKQTIPYEVVSFTDPRAGVVKAVEDRFLPVFQEFLTDNEDGYANTLKKILDEKSLPDNSLTLSTSGAGTSMRYNQANPGGGRSNFTPLILDDGQAMNNGQDNSQSITIRLYNPQPVNHVGVYFNSPGLSIPNFTVTTSDSLTYRPISPEYQTREWREYFDDYLQALEADDVLAGQERSSTIVFPERPNDSTTVITSTAPPTTGGLVYATLPREKGEIMFGGSQAQTWSKPSQSFDETRIAATDLTSFGPISGGKIRIAGLAGASLTNRLAFRYLKFFDKDNKQIMWKVAGDRSVPGGELFKGRFVSNYDGVTGTSTPTGLLYPYYGQGGRPDMYSNYERGYFTNNAASFETSAQTGDSYFYVSSFVRYTYTGQGSLGSLPPAEWAFYFPNGAQTVSYITYAGYSQDTSPTRARFSLTLFSEAGKQYDLLSYGNPTPGYFEYWEQLGSSQQVVIGKSQTTWDTSVLSIGTTNVQFNDGLSFLMGNYDWRYRNWSLRFINPRNFTFEAFSAALNRWVLLDTYRFEPDPSKPNYNLYVQVRWSRVDGGRFIDGSSFKSTTIDFSYLRFQSSQVPIRSINIDTSNLAYTLNNGFGTISGLNPQLSPNMSMAYVVEKSGGRTYTSVTVPTDLQNGDKVGLLFTLNDGSVFYDPAEPGKVIGANFKIDLPVVSDLPEPTNEDLSEKLNGWVQSDAKIKMAYEGSDYSGRIAQNTIDNLIVLQQTIPNAQVFIRYTLPQERRQVDIPVSDQGAIRALQLANDEPFSIYIRMINGNTISYLSSGMVKELLLNSYTVSSLPLPRFTPVPGAAAFNQSLYVPNSDLGVYELNQAAVINPNWELLVTVTNQSTFAITTYDSLPATLPGNVTIAIQVIARSGFAFGAADTYKSLPRVFDFSFNYGEVKSGSEVQALYVNYDANYLPVMTDAFPGIYGLNDYLGVIDAANSSLVSNLAASGLNVEMKINGQRAFILENGQLTVTKSQLVNGDIVELSVYPRLGYLWRSSTGLIPSYTRITRNYTISGLLTPTTDVTPDFNNEISGYDGGNTFAETVSGTSESVIAKAIKNYSDLWDAAGIGARIIYLPDGFLPSSVGLFSITDAYSPANPDRYGVLTVDGNRFNLKNGGVIVFMLYSKTATGDDVVRFVNGGTLWVKKITIAGLPANADLPPLPATDAKSVLDNNVFIGTVNDNSFGASFDPSWLTSFGVTAKIELYNDVNATTVVKQLGSTVPVQGPFVKGQVVSLTLSRNPRTLWWGTDVLVAPLTQNWRYVVPELPQSGSKIETTAYADLQTKSTVSFSGLNNSASAILNLGGTVPPIDTSLNRQTGDSGVSVVFTVYSGAVGTSLSSFYKQLPITAADIQKKQVVLASGPSDLAKIINGQFYTVRLLPNYGYELTLNNVTRPSDNPWLINTPSAVVSGLLENVFEASGLLRPIPVVFAGVSGINASITNLFNPAFLSPNFGKFEVYFGNATAQNTLYTPSAPNHFFTNGERIRVVLIPNHDKYVIDPTKTTTVNGKLVGTADDVYTQSMTVSGIAEPINLADVAGQFSAIKDWFTTIQVENGMYVKLSADVVTAINGNAKSRGLTIKDAVDYLFTFKDVNNNTINLPAEKFVQGVWLVDSVSDANADTNFYSYSKGGVQVSAAGKNGYALVDRKDAQSPYAPVAGNTSVLEDLTIAEGENKSVNVAAFSDALTPDPIFNTVDDYRAYESISDDIKPIIANALVKNRVKLELVSGTTPVTLTPNGAPGTNNSYALAFAKKNADGDIELVTTPEVDANGDLKLDPVSGAYVTPIARIELYFKGTILPKITINGTPDTALGLNLYSVTNQGGPGLSAPVHQDFFSASLDTAVRTIIPIPAAWSSIVADANANKQYYDYDISYEGNIIWQIGDLAKYVTIDQFFSYNLVVTNTNGATLWTGTNVFGTASPADVPANVLLAALKTIPAQFLLVDNTVTLSAQPTSANNTFDLSTKPAVSPDGFVFSASQWTIARIKLTSPQVKRAYYVPSNFAFNASSVSGLVGSPIFTGFSAFAFAPDGTPVTITLTDPLNPANPLKTVSLTDPSLVAATMDSFRDFIGRGLVLSISMNPRTTDTFVETLPNGTTKTYVNGTPFIRTITTNNVNRPLRFLTFAESDLRYSYDNATGNISVVVTDWVPILGETFADSRKNILFTVDHYRPGTAAPLHSTTNPLSYEDFVTFLADVPGKSNQTPANRQLAINDQLVIRMIVKDGYMFTNLTTEQSYRYTMRNEYVIKESIAIKKITAAYSTQQTTDTPAVEVQVNGVSTLVLAETIAELNAKGVRVTIEVNGTPYKDVLPPSVANGANVRITLEPINPLASTLLLEGETAPRTSYVVAFRVAGLLVPYELVVPSQITVRGTLNSQGSLDLSWITPTNAFKVTTWVDDEPTAVRVPDLRNGQQVRLAVEALQGSIIKKNNTFQKVLNIPTFTISGLKSFIEPPEFPDSLFLIYNPTTQTISSDRFVNTPFVTYSYKVFYVNQQSPTLNSLKEENLVGAYRIQVIATINPAQGVDDDYVFDATLAKTKSSDIYELKPGVDRKNMVIDLPTAFAEKQLLRTGSQYTLPDYAVPDNAKLRYAVGSQPSSVLKPGSINATDVVTITVELDPKTAAVVIVPAYTIPAISATNIIHITNTDFALDKVYGSEGDALLVFNEQVNTTASQKGVISELVVKRGDQVVFTGDSKVSFADQLKQAQLILKNNDVIELNFLPAENMIFDVPSSDQQHLLGQFTVTDLAPGNAQTFNTVALAISLAAVGAILLIGVPAYFFARRMSRQ